MIYHIFPTYLENSYRKIPGRYKSPNERKENFYNDERLREITKGKQIKQVPLQYYLGSSELAQTFCLLNGLDLKEKDIVLVDVPDGQMKYVGQLIEYLMEFQTKQVFKLYVCNEVYGLEKTNGYTNLWNEIKVA